MKPALVFEGLSQQELDRAYDQDVWAPNGAEVQARIIAGSAEIARRMPPRTRRYGPAEPQLIDIFAPRGAHDAPVFIFIHGGAWRLSMREAFYGCAPTIMSAGCILAIVGFQCLPAVSMMQMAAQVRDAIQWIRREIRAFGGDTGNLNLVGHSSGAHIAAAVLTTDWDALGLPPAGLRGGTLISGLYDLDPVMRSSRGRHIDLTAEETTTLSPIRHLDRFAGKASLWWGSRESPEFKRQSQIFANALRGVGRLTQATMLAGRNHFEMLEALNDADSPLVQSMFAAAS